MRIMLINHYAGSVYHGMEFRPYYMAKEWVKAGNEVVIAAADYSHLRKKNPEITKDFTEEDIDGIKYLWIKTNEYHGNGVGRAKNMWQFCRKMKAHAKKLADKYKPEAIIASSTYPFDIYIAKKIAKYCGARIYFEIHDLWPLTQIEVYKLSTGNPYVMLLQKAEDYAFSHSHKIISILPQADKHIKERGFDTSKFVYVPNGVIPSEAEITEEEKDCPQIKTLEKLREDGCFIVAYTGNHASANALEYFVEAASVNTDPKIKFVLVGKGNEKDNLMKLSQEKGSKVIFLDPVKKESMTALLSCVDVAYMSLAKCNLFNYGVSPNKLFDYMLAARPIIYAVEASNNPVRDADCGLTITVGDVAALNDAVKTLQNLTAEQRAKMGKHGRDYVLENHTYETLANKYLEALK